MRLIPVCLSLVLAPLMLAGQQAQPTKTQKSSAADSARKPSPPAPHKTVTKHRKRHHARKAAVRKSVKRAGLCPDSQFAATVINSTEVHQVCLDKTSLQKSQAATGKMKVDIINGSSTDTQYFSDKNQETARNQAVVVGVQSSDTRFAGGNKNSVVTGIVSSSTVDAKAASSGGEGVTRQVSPRPKRPSYQPDAH